MATAGGGPGSGRALSPPGGDVASVAMPPEAVPQGDTAGSTGGMQRDAFSPAVVVCSSAAELLHDMEQLSYVSRGATSIVFKGLWQGKQVAVKFMSAQPSSNSACMREAQLAQALVHPNIVRSYAVRYATLSADFFVQTIGPTTEQSLQDMAALAMSQAAGGRLLGAATNDSIGAAPTGDAAPPNIQSTGSSSDLDTVPPAASQDIISTAASQDVQQQPADTSLPSTAPSARPAAACENAPAQLASVATVTATGTAATAAAHAVCPASEPSSPDVASETLPQAVTSGTRPTGPALDIPLPRVAPEVPPASEASRSPPPPPPPSCSAQQAADVQSGHHTPWCDGLSWALVLRALQAEPGQMLIVILSEYGELGMLASVVHHGSLLSLRSMDTQQLCLATRAILRTAHELAQALEYMHQLHVIHADVKPGNVVLFKSDKDARGFTAKLTDFGFARVLPKGNATTTRMPAAPAASTSGQQGSAAAAVQDEDMVRDDVDWGTTIYMPPEHFAGTLCLASDVYSFGVTLWEMCHAARPWSSLQRGQISQGVLTGRIRLLWSAPAPAPLVDLVGRCMEHNPDNRPSMAQLVHELSELEQFVKTYARNQLPAQVQPAPDTQPSLARDQHNTAQNPPSPAQDTPSPAQDLPSPAHNLPSPALHTSVSPPIQQASTIARTAAVGSHLAPARQLSPQSTINTPQVNISSPPANTSTPQANVSSPHPSQGLPSTAGGVAIAGPNIVQQVAEAAAVAAECARKAAVAVAAAARYAQQAQAAAATALSIAQRAMMVERAAEPSHQAVRQAADPSHQVVRSGSLQDARMAAGTAVNRVSSASSGQQPLNTNTPLRQQQAEEHAPASAGAGNYVDQFEVPRTFTSPLIPSSFAGQLGLPAPQVSPYLPPRIAPTQSPPSLPPAAMLAPRPDPKPPLNEDALPAMPLVVEGEVGHQSQEGMNESAGLSELYGQLADIALAVDEQLQLAAAGTLHMSVPETEEQAAADIVAAAAGEKSQE